MHLRKLAQKHGGVVGGSKGVAVTGMNAETRDKLVGGCMTT